MAKKKKPGPKARPVVAINVRVDPAVWERLAAAMMERRATGVRPCSQTAIVERAIGEWLDREGF